jgi:L-asparaginase II
VIERSGLIESRHLGAAAVIAPDGSLARAIGDVTALIYPRSTLKLVQAIALLDAGTELDGEQLVLAAASHLGTPRHVAIVAALLARAGLDESALQCPADWPGDAGAKASASGPRRLAMTCSGKHAAFLLTCVVNGWPVASYLEAGHPLQQHIRATVETYTGEPVEHAGVDGCGAPVFAVTLAGLATAVGRIAGATRETDPLAAKLASAIRENGWAIDNATIEILIDELGLIAKSGVEGVFVAGALDGTAVAVKMLDGSSRATIPVGLALLARARAIDVTRAEEITERTTDKILGAGTRVGSLRVTLDA